MMCLMESAKLTEKARKILKEIVRRGGVMRFSELKDSLKISDGALNYNLEKLIYQGFIEKVRDSGVYRLKNMTPWLFFSNDRNALAESFVYVGLLGKAREEIEEPVYRVAINLISRTPDITMNPREWGLGIKPRYIYIVTSESGKSSWEGLGDVDNWILLPEEDLWNIDKVKERLLKTLEFLMRDHAVLLDTTGDGKPPALAFYEIANERFVPTIYVHRTSTRKILRWLISPSDIAIKLYIAELAKEGNIP